MRFFDRAPVIIVTEFAGLSDLTCKSGPLLDPLQLWIRQSTGG